MEEKNFQKAAEVLSESWEKTVVDGHSVNCRATPVGSLYKPRTLEPVWVVKHCQKSRHCLQIVKCQESSCCSSFQTNWPTVILDRFIPFPSIYEYVHKQRQRTCRNFQTVSKLVLSNNLHIPHLASIYKSCSSGRSSMMMLLHLTCIAFP